LWDRVEHHDADSNGVKIHYVALGKGPLIVMIHGFPDFWYTWRKQMEVLSARYRVVAVDQRGYDLSDRPAGVEQYAMPLLVGDIGAVIKAEDETESTLAIRKLNAGLIKRTDIDISMLAIGDGVTFAVRKF